MPFQCYSQRLLNPFRGTINCIRYKSAEAVTADGVQWDIYVSHDGLLKGLPYNRKTQVSDIRYGSGTRRTCELHARVQPLKIAHQFHLYPAIVEQAIIDVARVEARLRGTITEGKTGEAVMSTFYLELDPDQSG